MQSSAVSQSPALPASAWYEPILDRNLVPDWALRRGVRRLLRERLAEEDEGEPERQQQRLMRFVGELKRSPIAIHTTDANRQHYEVPAEFFGLVLGGRRKYSCCLWPEGVTELDEAEKRMLDVTVDRASIEDGQKILELGCGWGSLSLHMAQRFRRARIVGVSNSHSQRMYIEGQARLLGLDNLTIVTQDMNEFDPGAQFDRVVSVEMFEHMRNYEELLRRVALWLAPGGRLFVHIFAPEIRLSVRSARCQRLDGAALLYGRHHAERRSAALLPTRRADSGTLAGERSALPEDVGGMAEKHGPASRGDPGDFRQGIWSGERATLVGSMAHFFHCLRGIMGARRRKRVDRVALPL